MKKQISKQAKKASKLAKTENLKKKQAQIIMVKNAEGDPDTTAEILIQNQIDYTPKVSVIIPVYNVEQYLRECLDSVINQTLKEIEIICVDDGSTDNSLEILKEYAAKDIRITIIKQKNAGSGKARNNAMDNSKGEFIAFMDSDDMYPNDKTLEHMYKAAIKNKVLICGGSLNQLRDGTLVTDVSKFEKGYTFEKDGTIEYKDYQFDFGYWRFIYNRQFLEENKLCFPDYLRYQDPPFFIKTMVLAQKFYALKEATYVYRVSYKKVHWNERKALDFFKGARDCLFFANEYSLFDLCYLLTTRLNGSISKELFKKYTDVAEIHSVVSEITDYTDYRRLPLNTVDEDIKKYAVKRKINEVPCISIIIPCYKVEKYLRQCLNSVLKQTLKNIEIICINDGSPDSSLSIMREYAAIDKRIVIIDQENQGLSCARNNAISIAKGEYMWYVDSDDWIRKDACEILYKKAKENSLDVLNLARVNYDDETGKYKQLRWQKMDYVNSDKEIFSKDEVDGFIENIPISAVGYLYRRQFISDHDILFPEKLLFEDNYFLRKSLIFVRRFGIESKVLYFKRTHAGAITRNIANFFADYIKIVYMISTLYQDNHLDLNVVKKIINSYCKNLYSIFSYFSPSDKKKYQCDFFNFLYTMDRLYKLDFNLSSKIEKEIVVTYKNVCHSNLNIKDPQNYNEKIQWMKLYDSTPIKTRLADKYLVRNWVKEKIGEEYLIPLLGVYDRFEEINFDKLPKQFVIKCNHGCGYNIIVRDKSQLDLIETKANLDKWMKENFAFKAGFEMHYRDIKPKIIIEKFIENKGTNDLYDYKFWCFNGKVEYIQFLSERNLDGLKMAFYDRNWVKQDFVYSYPLDKKNMPRPDNLNLMIKLAEKLARGFNHVRVDFYRLNDGKLYFGEMTFTSASGNCKWSNERINQYFGSLIKLPKRAYNIDTGKYYRLPKPSKIKPYLLFPYYLFKVRQMRKKLSPKKPSLSFAHFLYHKVKTDSYTKTYICGIKVKKKPANIYEFIDKRLATLSNNWEKKFAAVVKTGAENKKALSTKISLLKTACQTEVKTMAETLQTNALNNRVAILEQLCQIPQQIAQNNMVNKKEITENHQKGLDDLLKNLKQYYVSRSKTDNYSLEFRTFADIAHCIRQNLKKLPSDVDLVVGIPRSGMIPAYIIALFMNKKCCSLDEFLSGSTGSNGVRNVGIDEIKKVLVIDDSVYNGTEMERTREKLAPLAEKYNFIYTTVYVKPDSEDKVDIWMEKVSAPRVWQWNYLNHSIAKRACFDMDGVLCIDPTADENDDGEKYLEFIAKTKPLYIPTYEINAIVTSRLEKYRKPTEKWLKDHGVKYKQLIMLDLPTAEERRKLGCHAKFKAEVYKKLSDTVLFVESEPNQAREIALLTGKTVICTSNDEVY